MKLRLLLITLLTSLTLVSGSAGAVNKEKSKRALQWAYMMNFVHYITWPDIKVDPVVHICIVGKHPFEPAARDISLNDKTGIITVLRYFTKLPDPQVLADCDMAYFAPNVSVAQLSFVFSKLTGLPVVTIGDHRGFNKIGGLMQFTENNKKLGFRVNKTLLNTNRLKIHPSLLRLSDR